MVTKLFASFFALLGMWSVGTLFLNALGWNYMFHMGALAISLAFFVGLAFAAVVWRKIK